MCRFRLNSQLASAAAPRLSAVGLALSLAACVAPIPIKDQAPKVSYSVSEKVALAVIDSRPILKADKKPATFIGRAHSVFGIPTDMHIYPWVALKEEKNFTLAQELEQRKFVIEPVRRWRCSRTPAKMSSRRRDRIRRAT